MKNKQIILMTLIIAVFSYFYINFLIRLNAKVDKFIQNSKEINETFNRINIKLERMNERIDLIDSILDNTHSDLKNNSEKYKKFNLK